MSAASRESASESNHFQSVSISSTVNTRSRGVPRSYAFKPSGGIRLNDVLRQRPAKHRGANLPTLFRLPPLALVDDGVQELPNVPSANIRGISLKDGRERAPQTALDRLGGAQAADNAPSKIEIDQRLDRDPRGCRISGLALLADQVTAACRAALVSSLARSRACSRLTSVVRPSDSRRILPFLECGTPGPTS